jgi:cobalamin synthase
MMPAESAQLKVRPPAGFAPTMALKIGFPALVLPILTPRLGQVAGDMVGAANAINNNAWIICPSR